MDRHTRPARANSRRSRRRRTARTVGRPTRCDHVGIRGARTGGTKRWHAGRDARQRLLPHGVPHAMPGWQTDHPPLRVQSGRRHRHAASPSFGQAMRAVRDRLRERRRAARTTSRCRRAKYEDGWRARPPAERQNALVRLRPGGRRRSAALPRSEARHRPDDHQRNAERHRRDVRHQNAEHHRRDVRRLQGVRHRLRGVHQDRHGDRQSREPQTRQALFPPRLLRVRISTWFCSKPKVPALNGRIHQTFRSGFPWQIAPDHLESADKSARRRRHERGTNSSGNCLMIAGELRVRVSAIGLDAEALIP